MSKKQSFINEMQSLMNSVDYKWASDEAKTYWGGSRVPARSRKAYVH